MDLSPYRDIREKELRHQGYFLAEGKLVVNRLLATDWPLHSVVCLPGLHEEYLLTVRGRCPVYTLSQPELESWVGFPFHRGVLAAGIRRPFPNAAALLQNLERTGRDRSGLDEPGLVVVVCVDLVDAENLGAIIRSAAALGARAVILSSRCADVLGRRVIRTSMGAVFHLPLAIMRDDEAESRHMRTLGFCLAAATPEPSATALSRFEPPARAAVVLGNEGTGLTPEWLNRCDGRIQIPMAAGTDSLNVAVAAGIILYTVKSRMDAD